MENVDIVFYLSVLKHLFYGGEMQWNEYRHTLNTTLKGKRVTGEDTKQ